MAASSKIAIIEDMMSEICAASDFSHQSPIRWVVLEEIICPGANYTVVKNVSRTRWIARLDAYDNFSNLLPTILTAIETIAKNTDGKCIWSNVENANAKTLIMSSCQFQSIIIAVVVTKMFSDTRDLTKKL